MILSTEKLIDGFFSIVSNLETEFVDIIIKKVRLDRKIEEVQERVTRFKNQFLQILMQRTSELLDVASTVKTSQFQQFKSRQIEYIERKQKQADKKCIIYQLRSILKNKLVNMRQSLHRSYLSIKQSELTKEQQRISMLNSSIVMIEKDLGIYNQQNQENNPHLMNSQKSPEIHFQSQAKDNFSSFSQSFDQNHNFLKKSFFTQSNHSIQRNTKKQQKITKLMQLVNGLKEKNSKELIYTMKALKCQSALFNLSSRQGKNCQKIQLNLQSKNLKTQRNKINSLKQEKQVIAYNSTNNYKQPPIGSTIPKFNKISEKTSQSIKQKKTVVFSKGKGIFQDILKQSYESFIQQDVKK